MPNTVTEGEFLANAPVLLNEFVPPELKKEFAAVTLNTPPARLLNVPLLVRICPSVQLTVPELSIVRDSVLAAVPEIVIVAPDATVVLPLPDIVPPVQLNVGVLKLPDPFNVPPFASDKLGAATAELNVKVPPVFTKLEPAPLLRFTPEPMVNVPPLVLNTPLFTKLITLSVMFPAAASIVPLFVNELPLKVIVPAATSAVIGAELTMDPVENPVPIW